MPSGRSGEGPWRTTRRAVVALASIGAVAAIFGTVRVASPQFEGRPPRRHLGRSTAPLRPQLLTYSTVVENRYWDITVRDVGSGQTRRITRQSSMTMACDWTHDGGRLAFMTNRDGNLEIYSMAADGSDWRRLTNTTRNDYGPEWSPDGRHIAYAEDVGGGLLQIFLANPDGSSRVQLTSGTAGGYAPVWSPDGTRIAFVAGTVLKTMASDGSDQVTLFTDSAEKMPTDWSADGTRVLFMARVAGIFKLDTIRLVDGAVEPVPTGDYDTWAARWSPDGSLISFYSYGIASEGFPTGMAAVFLMNADGTDLRQVTTLTANDRSWHPLWGP